MAVRGIDDNDVRFGVEKRFGASVAEVADTGRRSHTQTSFFVLAGIGVLGGFLHVLDGNQADAAIVIIDDEKLFDTMLMQ